MQVEQLIIVFHVLVALAIIALILLQQGKGSEMGASFGAGSSQTVFGGAGGGNVLTKATAILSALFFSTSFALAIVAKNHAGSAGAVEFDLPVIEESRVVDPNTMPSVGEDSDSEIPDIDRGSAGGSEVPAVD